MTHLSMALLVCFAFACSGKRAAFRPASTKAEVTQTTKKSDSVRDDCRQARKAEAALLIETIRDEDPDSELTSKIEQWVAEQEMVQESLPGATRLRTRVRLVAHERLQMSLVAAEHDVRSACSLEWYANPDDFCSEGLRLRGAPPPKGYRVWCETDTGVAQGPVTVWHKNGKKWEETFFTAGKNNGFHISWDKQGRLEGMGNFVNDKKHGRWILQIGEQQGIGDYNMDKKHGPWTSWHPSGVKALEGEYMHGKKDGTWNVWNEAGKLIGVFNFKLGTGDYVEWHDNGTKLLEAEYLDGKPEGAWVYWNLQGHIDRIENYRAGTITETIMCRECQPNCAPACKSDHGR